MRDINEIKKMMNYLIGLAEEQELKQEEAIDWLIKDQNDEEELENLRDLMWEIKNRDIDDIDSIMEHLEINGYLN
jgi:hypothetical protein